MGVVRERKHKQTEVLCPPRDPTTLVAGSTKHSIQGRAIAAGMVQAFSAVIAVMGVGAGVGQIRFNLDFVPFPRTAGIGWYLIWY
jgi:hypothetical protein